MVKGFPCTKQKYFQTEIQLSQSSVKNNKDEFRHE